MRSKERSTEALLNQIIRWSQRTIQTEEFMEFKKQSIKYILLHDDPYAGDIVKPMEQFTFTDEVDKQHALVMSFYGLHQSLSGLRQTEFYFRRYPFWGLPVTRSDHLRNICEMYFTAFYVLRSRIKVTLNLLNKNVHPHQLAIGPFIRNFDREFDVELRHRNQVHHRESFADLGIDKVMMTELVLSGDARPRSGWHGMHREAYRTLTREWAERVRRRSKVADMYVETVAAVILREATFLAPPDEQSSATE